MTEDKHIIHLIITDIENYTKYVPVIRKFTGDSIAVIIDKIKNNTYVVTYDLNYSVMGNPTKHLFRSFIDELLVLGCQMRLFEEYENETKEINLAQLDRRIKHGKEKKRDSAKEKEAGKYKHKLIRKAVRHYEYFRPYDVKADFELFFANYQRKIEFYVRPKYSEKRKRQAFEKMIEEGRIYEVLLAGSLSQHAAKSLLYQGDKSCWKQFERSAYFWTVQMTELFNERFRYLDLESLVFGLQYALYVERYDLISSMIQSARKLFAKEKSGNQSYEVLYDPPRSIVLFTNFMLGKTEFYNSVPEHFLFGEFSMEGYGHYQRIVDDWDKNFCDIEDEYWDSLCEFHLSEISVKGSYEYNDELVDFGLIPMELLNLFKIRKMLNLSVPVIKHELFQTPMSKEPILPTGYNANLDVRFQLIDRTQKQEKIFSVDEIIKQLKDEYGEDADLFY